MEKAVLNVEGMSCQHCVKAVTGAVSGLDGISAVTVDLGGGTVSFEYDGALVTIDAVKAAIEDQGYDIV